MAQCRDLPRKKGFNAKKGLKTEGVDGNEVLT